MADPQLEPTAVGHSYRCDQCGAQMAFDGKTGELLCGSCGSRKQAQGAAAIGAASAVPGGDPSVVQGSIREYALDHGLILARSQGLGTEVQSSRCDECGAVVQFASGVTATRCAFCDSPKVLAQKSQAGITPESLVPFQMDQAKAREAFHGWLKKLWFRPNDLTRGSSIHELRGVYVPYWTFDAQAHSDWQAQAGYHYYVQESYTTMENGRSVTRTRSVQRTRWEPASGQRDDFHDDHLVCASKGLPDDLVRKVSNFETKSLVPYAPSYLAGWSAEAYAIGLEPGWERAQSEISSEQQKRCARDVPGDTHRFLQVETVLKDVTFKHVLLPVWIAAFRYREQIFRFLVNGQTGHVTGKAPLSWIKICLFIATILALIVAAVILGRR